MQCYGCKFFKRRNEQGGYCWRYPPQLVYEVGFHGASGQVSQHFPYMENTEWCGEHQPIPATVPVR